MYRTWALKLNSILNQEQSLTYEDLPSPPGCNISFALSEFHK